MMSSSEVRRLLNILIEADSEEFDRVAYIRHLSMLAIEIHQMSKTNKDPTALKQSLAKLFDLIRIGRKEASHLPEDDKKTLLSQIQRLFVASGFAPKPIPLPAKQADDESEPDASNSPHLGHDTQISPSEDPTSQPTEPKKQNGPEWQVIKLALKATDDGLRRALGIARKNYDYFIFVGTVGQKYNVSKPQTYDIAAKQFSDAIEKHDYHEVSPGAYSAFRLGAHIQTDQGGQRVSKTPIPLTKAQYWRPQGRNA